MSDLLKKDKEEMFNEYLLSAPCPELLPKEFVDKFKHCKHLQPKPLKSKKLGDAIIELLCMYHSTEEEYEDE